MKRTQGIRYRPHAHRLTAIGLLTIALASPLLASGRLMRDGYLWGEPEHNLSAVQVTITYVPNRPALFQLLKEKGGAEANAKRDGESRPPKLNAFSILEPSKAACHIYAISPETDYRPEYLGHELMHCFHGRWHD
jgi:hypothetical protein